jgi:ATP-binding cassette subfamily F protein 3
VTQLVFGGVGVDFGSSTIFDGISFTVSAGERWGILGRNGSGKTTLFRLMTGTLTPTRGSVSRQSALRVSLLEQHRDFGGATTVWEAAAGSFAELLSLEQSIAEQAHALGQDSGEQALAKYGRDLERFERSGGYTIAPRVDAVLQGLGFDPIAARSTDVASLSGGERGRLGLARQLVDPADVILLDEPTNHLDLETTRWLEQYLSTATATVLLVSHDRAFLAAIVDHVLHFEGGTATSYAGGYEAFVVQREERRLTQQRAFDVQKRVIAHESDYIARNIAGHNSKQAKGRRKRLARLPRMSPPPSDESGMAVRFSSGQRGGDRVIVAEHVDIDIGERRLISDFTGTLMRGEIVGLVGPNGAGKSTFIRALMGEHPVSAGDLRTGAALDVAYYRQDMAQVPLDRSLYEIIADLRPLWERRHTQGHLGRFGFSGDEVQRIAGTLSGGERARVALAMLTLGQANLLILDEPTNHLDVESIEGLEDALEAYDGSVLLVSHDRELLRALTSRVWVLHAGHITDFPGSFAEWEIVATEREHAASVRASEAEGLRRVKERQTVARERPQRDLRTALRKAEREMSDVESEIAQLEQRIATITLTLDDPELYLQDRGRGDAVRLGAELERLRITLDRALERWTTVSDVIEAAKR